MIKKIRIADIIEEITTEIDKDRKKYTSMTNQQLCKWLYENFKFEISCNNVSNIRHKLSIVKSAEEKKQQRNNSGWVWDGVHVYRRS
jgi:CRISPR/Cas system CSM-associated protein Csm4 (group 5 of RAMP superfamily)